MKAILQTTVLILRCLAFTIKDIITQNGTIEAAEGVIIGNNNAVVAGTIRSA